MKKYLLIMLLSFCTLQAQIKIGGMEISEKMAGEFFVYCRTYPDTITISLGNGGYSEEDECRFKELDRQSLSGRKCLTPKGGGWVYAFQWIIPKKPTEYNFMRWFIDRNKKRKT